MRDNLITVQYKAYIVIVYYLHNLTIFYTIWYFGYDFIINIV
jgi:hypothetical protein